MIRLRLYGKQIKPTWAIWGFTTMMYGAYKSFEFKKQLKKLEFKLKKPGCHPMGFSRIK